MDQTQEIEFEFSDDSNAKDYSFQLVICTSPVKNGDYVTEQEFDLNLGENIVGRDPSCDIHINSQILSKKHAAIYIHQNEQEICDLGSRNKTRRGKMILKPHVHYELRPDQFIYLGNIKAKVTRQVRIDNGNIVSDTDSETLFVEQSMEDVLVSDSDVTDAEESIEKQLELIPETPHPAPKKVDLKEFFEHKDNENFTDESRPTSSLLLEEEPQIDFISENDSDGSSSILNESTCTKVSSQKHATIEPASKSTEEIVLKLDFSLSEVEDDETVIPETQEVTEQDALVSDNLSSPIKSPVLTDNNVMLPPTQPYFENASSRSKSQCEVHESKMSSRPDTPPEISDDIKEKEDYRVKSDICLPQTQIYAETCVEKQPQSYLVKVNSVLQDEDKNSNGIVNGHKNKVLATQPYVLREDDFSENDLVLQTRPESKDARSDVDILATQLYIESSQEQSSSELVGNNLDNFLATQPYLNGKFEDENETNLNSEVCFMPTQPYHEPAVVECSNPPIKSNLGLLTTAKTLNELADNDDLALQATQAYSDPASINGTQNSESSSPKKPYEDSTKSKEKVVRARGRKKRVKVTSCTDMLSTPPYLEPAESIEVGCPKFLISDDSKTSKTMTNDIERDELAVQVTQAFPDPPYQNNDPVSPKKKNDGEEKNIRGRGRKKRSKLTPNISILSTQPYLEPPEPVETEFSTLGSMLATQPYPPMLPINEQSDDEDLAMQATQAYSDPTSKDDDIVQPELLLSTQPYTDTNSDLNNLSRCQTMCGEEETLFKTCGHKKRLKTYSKSEKCSAKISKLGKTTTKKLYLDTPTTSMMETQPYLAPDKDDLALQATQAYVDPNFLSKCETSRNDEEPIVKIRGRKKRNKCTPKPELCSAEITNSASTSKTNQSDPNFPSASILESERDDLAMQATQAYSDPSKEEIVEQMSPAKNVEKMSDSTHSFKNESHNNEETVTRTKKGRKRVSDKKDAVFVEPEAVLQKKSQKSRTSLRKNRKGRNVKVDNEESDQTQFEIDTAKLDVTIETSVKSDVSIGKMRSTRSVRKTKTAKDVPEDLKTQPKVSRKRIKSTDVENEEFTAIKEKQPKSERAKKSKLDISCSKEEDAKRKSMSQNTVVVLTGSTNTPANRKIVEGLGGKITESIYECNLLLTDKFRRTVKTLCCVALGKPIIKTLWLQKCKKAKNLIDPMEFLLVDKAAEKQYDFSLKLTSELSAQKPLLKGLKVYVTPNTKPPPAEMKEIIIAAGGKYHQKMPKSKDVIVVSCDQDKESIPSSVHIVSNEYLLTGILRYDSNHTSYSLK